jgi:hypothetical protein
VWSGGCGLLVGGGGGGVVWTGNGILGMRGEGLMRVIWSKLGTRPFDAGQVIKHDPGEWFSLLHGWKRVCTAMVYCP